MRSRRLIIVLALALISGLLAGWLALQLIGERRGDTTAGPTPAASAEIVVAARDLPLGRVLTAEDVKVVGWPGNALPENASSTVEEVLGRGVITPVTMNEPLLAGKMAVKEAGGGLPIVINEGMRAVSVRVNEVIQVAGFVMPGTHVDVFVTIDPPEGQSGGPITKLVLENVTVLTVNQIVQNSPNGDPVTATVATMLVSPDDAEKLIHASNKGQIQLGLRNTLDMDSVTTAGVQVRDLLPQILRAAPVRTVPTTRRTTQGIEIYRGNQLDVETVEGGF